MDSVDLRDVQGNILRGYHVAYVRHFVVKVTNTAAARHFIAAVISGNAELAPQLTTAEQWSEKPAACFNVGITAAGLRALGVSDASLKTFPAEFLEGPVKRATKVGDVGTSAPAHWQHGFAEPDTVHVMWSIHAGAPGDVNAPALIEEATQRLESLWAASRAFTVISRLDGSAFDGDKVHFGYRDSISQPRFKVIDLRPTDGHPTDQTPTETLSGKRDHQPISPVGAVLLGYDSTFPDVKWQMPHPKALGVNGCFNAFRMLQQDVDAFEDFLTETASKHCAERPFVTKEWVAAKLMGRWRNGVPLALAPYSSDDTRPNGPGFLGTDIESDLNFFDYPDMDPAWNDSGGEHCPIGSHIRRGNPRGARIVQRSANNTRRIVRRGMPYGPPYDPLHPRDGKPRGLLGNFMCASLIAQYESIMYDWINLGLQDPRITGTNDPILGANNERTSRFEIPMAGEPPIVLTGFPRFITTVGGAYLFCPSVTALRLIAQSG
jgi:deferrochelatase/peroxidase EfeB